MSPEVGSAAPLAVPGAVVLAERGTHAVPRPMRARWALALAAAPMFAAGAVQFALPFRELQGGLPDLSVYADDVFFYLVIAARVLAGEGFSFDGLVPTNGFHPLWMVVLLAIGAVTPPRSLGFFIALQAVLAAATLAAALGCFRMLRRTFGFAAVPALTATLLVSVNMLWIAGTGMESALAVPLIFVAIPAAAQLIEAPSPTRALAAALLASAAILARLDAAILIALIAAAGVIGATRAGRLGELMAPRALAGLAAGALPLAVYVGANLAAFGAVMPISGRAKQLAEGLFFNRIAAFHFFGGGAHWLMELGPFNPDVMIGTVPALLIIELAVLSLRARTIPRQAPLGWMLVAFPAIYLLLLAVISDWMIWPWYMYALVPATALAAAAVAEVARPVWQRAPMALPAAMGLVGAGLVVHIALRTPEPHHSIVETGRVLAAFAAAHPGRYAMGDRAGAFAFLTDQRVVQTEGLVGDAALLAAIRARRPLLEELAARGVDYYVGSDMARDGDCWLAEEPHVRQAGARSPRMTARICRPPVFSTVSRDGIAAQVFDLHALH
jgi:hypothetical protein